MRRVGLFVKRDEEVRKKAQNLTQLLHERGVEVLEAAWVNPEPVPRDLACVLVLGGDGTFLSAARWIGKKSIPLMGIKFGEVGFLAETLEDNLITAVETILAGDFSVEERMRLSVTVIRNNRKITSQDVLNDVVLTKSALSRLAYSAVYINGQYLTTFKSDGLIVGTPTGSTAYSLAAGGPVIHPAVPGIILTPICPFTLTNRPLIIPDTSEVEIRLGEDPEDILLTFDGQEGLAIHSGDRIRVKKSAHPMKMISLSDQSYFNALKARLMWSGGRE